MLYIFCIYLYLYWKNISKYGHYVINGHYIINAILLLSPTIIYETHVWDVFMQNLEEHQFLYFHTELIISSQTFFPLYYTFLWNIPQSIKSPSQKHETSYNEPPLSPSPHQHQSLVILILWPPASVSAKDFTFQANIAFC